MAHVWRHLKLRNEDTYVGSMLCRIDEYGFFPRDLPINVEAALVNSKIAVPVDVTDEIYWQPALDKASAEVDALALQVRNQKLVLSSTEVALLKAQDRLKTIQGMKADAMRKPKFPDVVAEGAVEVSGAAVDGVDEGVDESDDSDASVEETKSGGLFRGRGRRKKS